MRVHELKTWSEPFAAVLDGRKRYEIRRDDRGFSVGDELHLREWIPVHSSNDAGEYTGRSLRVRVMYMTPGGAWGLPAGLCAMGIERLQPAHSDDESRCAVCGWPLEHQPEKGCVRGNCSERPRPTDLYAPERATKEANRG